MTFSQPVEYKATATYVVRLASFFEGDRNFVSALDTLSRRTEIATTFAEVANSHLIKSQAAEQLGLTDQQRKAMAANSRLIAGTNVLEIAATGPDPALVAEYANAIGLNLVAYARNLYETYELEPLDAATRSSSSANTSKALNLILGGVVGLVLGAGTVFLAEYLRAPESNAVHLSIVDQETGAHNSRYFMLRLRQEMSRARRNGYPLSIALIDINHRGALNGSPSKVRHDAMRRVVSMLEPHLRDEDVMARFDETVLAILLPDMSAESARETTEELRARLGWTPLEIGSAGVKLSVHGAAGVVAYNGNGLGQDELLAQAMRALKDAENDTYGKVRVFAEADGQH